MPTQDYRLADGTKVPGTTTVINSNCGWKTGGLVFWAWQQGKDGKDFRETRDAAANAGTIAHYLVECDLRKIQPDTSQMHPDLVAKAMQAFENYREWREVYNLQVIASELPLVSERYGYGGTLDCVSYITGRLSMTDWKTGDGVYPDFLLQMAAYVNLWEEHHPEEPIERIDLIRFAKETASFSHHKWARETIMGEPWQAFHALLEVERVRKAVKKLAA